MEEAVFQVEQGVHPVLASSSDPLSHHFVSNDCSLDPHRLWVLTGPNMGGVCVCGGREGVRVSRTEKESSQFCTLCTIKCACMQIVIVSLDMNAAF